MGVDFSSPCSVCRGLCCSELFFSKADGFPCDKVGGTPCPHLLGDFRCAIHGALSTKGLVGCLAYDCLGAGPAACMRCAPGDRRTEAVFSALYRLHEMLWYLSEAEDAALSPLLRETESLAARDSDGLLALDLDAHRSRVNAVLRPLTRRLSPLPPPKGELMGRRFHGADLTNVDFSMALLLGADLSRCTLRGAGFLGADLRGADLRGADLAGSHFLTPRQLASARGDGATKLPHRLGRPGHWEA